MPQYEVELDNGQVLTLEGDHPPSEEEVKASYGQWQRQQRRSSRLRPPVEIPEPAQAPPEDKTSFMGTLAREGLLALPSTYAAKEFGEAGAGGGGFLGGLATGGNPIGVGIGAVTGAVTAGGTAAGLTDYGEEMLLKKYAPDFYKEVEQGRKEHPWASRLGRFGVGLGMFKLDYKTIPNAIRSLKYWRTGTAPQRKLVTDAIKNLGIGAGTGVAIPLMHGEAPTKEDIFTGIAQGALYGRPYDWTRKISPGSRVMESMLGRITAPRTQRTPDASGQQETTEVHGNVQPQQAPPVIVPQQEGGAGVQPQAQAVGKETQVPLAPKGPVITGNDKFGYTINYGGRFESGFETRKEADDFMHEVFAGRAQLKYEEGQPMSREDLERTRQAEAEYQKQQETGITEEEAQHRDLAEQAAKDKVPPGFTAEPGTSDDNVPFGWSRMGKNHFLQALGGKRIAINREELRQWAADQYHAGFSADEVANMLEARMDEEVRHNKFIDAVGGRKVADVKAKQFWDTLTAAEKRVVIRKYIGKWGRGNRPDYLLGYEAIRMIDQRRAGVPEGDVLETMAIENLGLRSLSVLSDMLRGAREKLGTKAALKGKSILEEAKAGLDAMDQAEPAKEGQAGPGAARRALPDLEQDAQRLTTFIARATKQVDAADLSGRPGIRENWQRQIDAATRQLAAINSQISQHQQEQDFPAAERQVPDEEIPGKIHREMTRYHRSLNVMNDRALFRFYALHHANDWDVSKHGQDQILAWFDRQEGGKFDRRKTIDAEHAAVEAQINQAKASGAPPSGKEMAELITRETYLRMLKEDLDTNKRMSDEYYSPAATRQDREKMDKIRYLEGRAAQFRSAGKEKEAVLAETEAARLKKELPPKIGPGAERRDLLRYIDQYDELSDNIEKLHGQFMGRFYDYASKHDDFSVNTSDAMLLKYPEFNEVIHREVIGQLPDELKAQAEQIRDLVGEVKDLQREPEFRLYKKLMWKGEGYPDKTGPGVGPAAERKPRYTEQDLLAPQGQLPYKGWMRPDGRIIEVEALHLATARDLTGKDPEDAGQHLIDRGYLRIYKDLWGLHLLQGKASEKQLGELRSLAAENNLKLLDESDQEYPGASRKKKPSEKDEPMLLGNLTKSGEQREPGKMVVPVKPEERKVEVDPLTEEQMAAGRRPPPTPEELRDVVAPQIKGNAPNYDEFYDAMEKSFGKRNAEELAPELFQNLAWKELMSATPERLAQLISSYRLGPKIGIKKLPVMRESDIARINDPKAREAARAQAELFKGKQPELSANEMEKLVNRLRGKNFRSTAISTIAREMFRGMEAKEEASYNKKVVEFEDIDFDNPKGKPSGYHEFTPGESNSPKLLSEILSNRGRAGSKAPVSASYRLVALRNRLNGKVELVSAYDDFRRGVVVYRPGRNMYMPITEVDPNMKFFATILLNEPVQKFEYHFKNTDEFQRHFDSKNAERLSKGAVVAGPQKQAGVIRPGEGTEGRESLERLAMAAVEGGEGKEGMRQLTGRQALSRFAGVSGAQGPESDLIAAMRGLGAGELERAVSGDAPLEGPEASGLHRVMDEMQITSPEDMKEMLWLLDGMAQRGRIEGRHYQALSALYKIAGAIQRAAQGEAKETTSKIPTEKLPLTPDQLHDATLQAAYEAFTKKKTREDFVLDALLNFGWEPSRLGEPVPKTPPVRSEEPGPPEITMPIERRPPTEAEFIGPTHPAELTTAHPGYVSGPEMLSPEARAAVEAYAKNLVFKKEQGSPQLEPYQPTKPVAGPPVGPGEYGGPKFKGEVPKGEPKEFPFESSHSFEATKWHIKTKPQKKSNVPTWTKQGQGKMDFDSGPGAINKYAQEIHDELKILYGKMGIAAKRGLTSQDIAAQADGVHRISEQYAIRDGQRIRWASIPDDVKATLGERLMFKDVGDREGPKRVRKAVVPWNAALSIRSDAEYERVRLEWRALLDKEAEDKKDRIRAAQETGDQAAIDKAKDEHPSIYRDPADEPRYVRPTAPLPQDFDPLILKATKGIHKAQDLLRSPDVNLRKLGKKWMEGATELRDLAEWTKANLEHPELPRTAQAFRDVMDQHLSLMLTEGSNIAARDFYVPDRFGAETWDDGMLAFGEQRLLGTNYRLPRVFTDYYDAIQASDKKGRGYYPVNLDVADLAQHSLMRGMRRIAWQDWGEILKGTIDPQSKQPVAIAPDLIPVHKRIRNSSTGILEEHTVLEPQIPSGKQEYEMVSIGGPKGTVIAVRKGYKPLVETMMEESKVPDMPGGKAALAVTHALKHGVILLLDTFHPGRLAQYAVALGGRSWSSIPGRQGRQGYKSGYTALSWHPEDIPRAVKAGLISAEDAKWALEPVKMYDAGVIRNMTRHQLASIYLAQGLNANRSADFLYRNAVQAIPVIGPKWYKTFVDKPSKFLFDRYTPGLITEMAIRNLERQNPGDRKTPLIRQMRYIARDTNAFFGNMGRQGFFKNPTFRDFAQLTVLAPLWQEGLLRKEFTTAYRLASGVKYLKGGQARSFEAHLGPITYGVMRGLGMYFVLTQALNLITKHHFTWQNEEEGRKMEAWLPNGFGGGIWISPLSVFAETAHEFIRLYQTKATAWETGTRLGLNKAGPFGRIANILWTQQNPSGEHITSTPGVWGTAAQELAPVPISVGTYIKEGVYQTTGIGRPSPPGSILQRAISAVGVKSELDRRPEQDIARMADKFMKEEGLKHQPLQMVPTDEPSYPKLRGAIRNKDFVGAKKLLNELRKQHTDAQILHAMKLASTRPFTGSVKGETLFMYSLNDHQLDLYTQANLNRAQLYQDFLEWYMSQ